MVGYERKKKKEKEKHSMQDIVPEIKTFGCSVNLLQAVRLRTQTFFCLA